MHCSLSHSCAESALEFSRGRLLYSRPLRSPPGALSFGALLQSFFSSRCGAHGARAAAERSTAPAQLGNAPLTHSLARAAAPEFTAVCTPAESSRPQPRPTDARIRQHPFFATTDGGGISGVVFDGCCVPRVFEEYGF